ncbi:MAG: NADP-dependent oxidoreductase [Bryobacteraceae bacterium]
MPESMKRIVLASRPVGAPKDSDFRFEEVAVPEPTEGEVLAKVLYLSVDPYMRGRMRDRASYSQPFALNEPLYGGGVSRVVASKSPRFALGDYIEGMTPWQPWITTTGKGFRKLDPAVAPVSTALGVLGMPGLTAYFGLLTVGAAKAGETVVVSGAAGAVGSIAGQIAKIQGCRVVGIAGSDDKVAWLTEELGFDAAFNYKTTGDYRKTLAEFCPSGVDVYFDNVGGPISDAVMPLLNVKARIPICGQISQYNDESAPLGPRSDFYLIIKRARKEGFLVIDFAERYGEGLSALTGWVREGKLRYREQFELGLENMVRAFTGMMEGSNTGKMLVKIAAE